MHPCFEKADALSGRAIGAAIDVHRTLGPGLLESIYERCMVHELESIGLKVANQREVSIKYKDLTFTETLRFDILVEDCLLLEIKAVERLLPVHRAQLMSYMKLLNVPVGLLINFHEPVLKGGVVRLVLPGSNKPETPAFTETTGAADLSTLR